MLSNKKESRSQLLLSSNFIIYVPLMILFFLMLLTPSLNQEIKAPFLFLSLLIALYNIKDRKIKINSFVFFFTCLNIFCGIFFVVYGFFMNAPGAFSVMSVYIIWPIIFTFFYLGFIIDEQYLPNIFSFFVLVTIIISIYSIVFILRELGMWPQALFFQIDPKQGIGIYEGKIEFRLSAISSLLFLGPLLISSIILFPRNYQPKVRKYIYLGIILSFIVALLSGRRALQLAMILSFFVAIFFRMLNNRESPLKLLRVFFKVFLLVLLIGAFILIFFEINIQLILDDILAGFSYSGKMGESEYYRYVQFNALWNDWKENPLLGYGLGSYSDKCIRSAEMPWTYELTYLALLFQIGILGMLVYLTSMCWVIFKSIDILRKDRFIGTYLSVFLIASIIFLIGNATNPYLLKYDFVWIVFFPIGIINLFLTKNGK